MTVKELIGELKKCNPDGEVYTADNLLITNVEDYTGDGESYVIE